MSKDSEMLASALLAA